LWVRREWIRCTARVGADHLSLTRLAPPPSLPTHTHPNTQTQPPQTKPNPTNQGNRNRTTKATEVNDVSSRSHAICQIVLRARESGRMYGKLSLVDLAGACVREMDGWVDG
jgi:hypothetical protein